ncbi:DUF5333 family protein [Roseobacter sp. S98]|uniref:DUF5333 family protein n=1 Tax=Roseobacter algicola (ex Choi et al. 2025) (nom. illeg.) TaxID=3092138 RepID=UPI0035C78665
MRAGAYHAAGQLRLMIAAAVLAPLAACAAPDAPVVEEAPATPEALAELNEATLYFAQNAGIASYYVTRCGGAGVGYRLGTSTEMNLRFFDTLLERGYAPDQINAAAARVSREDISGAATAHLKARGVDGDDDAAVCAAALAEIDARTPVGNMMRRV